MQPMNSVITGVLAETQRRVAATGTSVSKPGSENLPVVDERAVRDWLLRQRDPEATDLALTRSLTSTLGVTVSPTTSLRFPVAGGYYHAVTGCSVESPGSESTELALTKVEQAMTPATAEQAEGWLVILQASTARRKGTEASGAVTFGVYASELRRWPADVAKTVCERMARGVGRPPGVNWFPTLAEIAQDCEKLAAPRAAMLAALQRRCGAPR